jgi:hypothetical protein
MALHNFIRESALEDELCDKCDEDEDFVPSVDRLTTPQLFMPGMEEGDMTKFRDGIVDGHVIVGEFYADCIFWTDDMD